MVNKGWTLDAYSNATLVIVHSCHTAEELLLQYYIIDWWRYSSRKQKCCSLLYVVVIVANLSRRTDGCHGTYSITGTASWSHHEGQFINFDTFCKTYIFIQWLRFDSRRHPINQCYARTCGTVDWNLMFKPLFRWTSEAHFCKTEAQCLNLSYGL